jgi:hypothetical protein
MFTNEFEPDATITTVLDESGEYEDVELVISDDCVIIQQPKGPDDEAYDVIMMSHQQWFEILAALKLPEGAYHARAERR